MQHFYVDTIEYQKIHFLFRACVLLMINVQLLTAINDQLLTERRGS